MLERAVRADPRASNFAGRGRLIEHCLDEGGGLATQEFAAHFAQLAEAKVRVLKQARMLREEKAAA
eukprot:8948270-Lingulodinium_polyedra.AAC.1